MLFGRRRKWNNGVAAMLPTFGLTIEEVGPMAALESLDLVYPKGFSEEEGALFLAYSSYLSLLRDDPVRAGSVKSRLTNAEEEWIKLGRVNPRNVEAWREKARRWENGYYSVSR